MGINILFQNQTLIIIEYKVMIKVVLHLGSDTIKKVEANIKQKLDSLLNGMPYK